MVQSFLSQIPHLQVGEVNLETCLSHRKQYVTDLSAVSDSTVNK